jgi:hypothetical protein
MNCAVLCVKYDWKGQFCDLRYCLSKLRSLLSFPSGMTSHSKIALFNWECVGHFKLPFKLTYLLTDWLTYLLTPWSRVLLEKLAGLQLVKKYPHFMESEGSLPHSKVPATFIYPEPGQSSSYPTPHFLKIHLNIILPSRRGSPQWSLSLRFPHQTPVHTSPFPIRATCPAYLIQHLGFPTKIVHDLLYVLFARRSK